LDSLKLLVEESRQAPGKLEARRDPAEESDVGLVLYPRLICSLP